MRKDDIGTIILFVVGISIIISLVFGIWYCGKSISYNLSYKSMVEQTIKDMVKQECLK